MSLFGSLGLMGGGFDDDPFTSTRSIFSQMDRMMSSMVRDPFGDDPFFRNASYPSLMAPSDDTSNRGDPNRRDPFGFSPYGSLMSSMGSMARDGSCHSYSSSSVMTMSTGPDGRPQLYQASSSSHGVPGGVRETRRSMADSSTGLRKMAIGHHIGDRSHLIEKEVGTDGGLEERQEFVNLDEDDVGTFDGEFKRGIQQARGALEYRPRYRTERQSANSPSRQRYLPALPATSSYRRRTRPTQAITSGSSRYEERTRQRERGGGRIRSRH